MTEGSLHAPTRHPVDWQNPDFYDEAKLDAELTRLGKSHEFHSYEGAGHSFFSVDRPAYRVEAALDGWRRISDFFTKHLEG